MSTLAVSPDEPDPDDPLRVLAAASGMDFLPVLPTPSPEAFALLPHSIAVQFSVAPVTTEPEEFSADATLCVAISDPLSFDLIDSVRFSLRCELRFVVAPPAEIQHILATFYPQAV